MARPFVHLHNHTQYSLLDGANRIPEMVARAKELEMPALAISDHGVMFGAMEFALECEKQGVKPIIGMEAYVAPDGMAKKQGREEAGAYHLLLLAKNEEGYRNLCRLHTAAALEGFYYKPRIDHEILRRHAKGLISSSTCLGSEVNQYLLAGEYDRAQYTAGMYKEIFGAENYFIELQDHGLAEQKQVNEQLVKIAQELGLPLVTTNDAHYLCKSDAEPHDVLLCIGTGSLLEEQQRLRFETKEFYVKSREEMATIFPDHPEALENTLRFAEMCDVHLSKQRAAMPTPDLPEGATPATYLKDLAEKGLTDRVKGVTDDHWKRLKFELEVIRQTGFESYFLLVREFTNFSRSQGIMTGVRGSAAGSLVSYTIGITDVDPVEYDLTFERFLNPERVSMPDIDLDFEDARREEVIRWVTEKYGTEHVAQIVTFGTLGAKAAMRDAGRVMGVPPIDIDKVCKLIPNGPGWSIDRAMKEVGDFRQAVKGDATMRRLVDAAKSVEGLARHCGVHAAGVVISKDPLAEHIPLYRSSDGMPVTGYEMGILEKIGLLKMDFLGLSNLTVLARALESIRDGITEPKTDLERALKSSESSDSLIQALHHVPLDDAGTYEMLSRGDTVGVFQLESGGMRRNIIELKPQNVRELAAMVALYRPGPMEHIARFVDNKFGRRQPEYLDERMRPILEETYGVIVYQDQVLKLVQALAGFSLGKADILRKAMGKKNLETMQQMQDEFSQGCQQNGVDASVAKRVWELLLPFAGYAFNKAHAVCYAIIAAQTAYLKAHYPVEYMAALLAVYRTKEDRVTTFIEECRRQGIAVLPPDVNRSSVDFTVEESNGERVVRFGLGAIKNVGQALVEHMMEEREKEPFAHLYDFCARVRVAGLNRLGLESLIKAGALDSIDPNRNKLIEYMDAGVVYADRAVRADRVGQDSLFGGDDESTKIELPTLPDVEPPSRTELLSWEKEILGIYVSDHPLRGYQRVLSQVASHSCSSIVDQPEGTRVKIAGVVSAVREITTKRGDRMASIVVEDFSGVAACTVFPQAFAKYRSRIGKDSVVALRGTVKHRQRLGSQEIEVEIAVDDVEAVVEEPSASEYDESVAGSLVVRVNSATRSELQELKSLIESSPGDFDVVIQFSREPGGQPVIPIHRVAATDEFVKKVKQAVADCETDLVCHANSPRATEHSPVSVR
ncbi:MAG TPA: DNA polymerase III subunit alpha [Fimbriimonadaceae bacterium]|nr:DNA polymerase III subunit alpha [Fimbriimonadaceae bacterium]